MPGKAKQQKHTAKELKGKEFAATVNRGGGSAGVADRKVCQTGFETWCTAVHLAWKRVVHAHCVVSCRAARRARYLTCNVRSTCAQG